MIQDVGSFEVGVVQPSLSAGALQARSATPVDRFAVQSASPEQEITRLTWQVLDGSASLADRQRLAELVDAQHAVRRRFDR